MLEGVRMVETATTAQHNDVAPGRRRASDEATSPPLKKEHWHDTRALYLVWTPVGTTLQI